MDTNRAQLIEVSLINCDFERSENLPVNFEGLKFNVNIDYGFNESKLRCKIQVNVWLDQADIPKIAELDDPNERLINCIVKMEGIFHIPEELGSDIKEKFARISAPAIIYPYIRETISSLFMRSNVPNTYIPIINFQEFEKGNKP